MSHPLQSQLNLRSWQACDHVQAMHHELDVIVSEIGGATILDFGIGARRGTIAGGISLGMICMADLANIQVLPANAELPLPQVSVATDFPLLACMAAQYAGWPFSDGDYFSMCSGPARMARGEEEVLTEYDLVQRSDVAVGVFETNQLPSAENVETFAKACGVSPTAVTLCLARTASLPGTLQVIARSIEVTMHKLHELKFDLATVKNALGRAPMPPIAGDDLTALGWTNDAILYGATVHLWIDHDDQSIEAMGQSLVSATSSDFGRPFLEIFEEYDRDFYKVDKMLFSPAHVVIHSLKSGKTFEFGACRNDILRRSFGL